MTDRPLWPPAAEITAQAFDDYAAWEWKWSEHLEDVEIVMRPTVYCSMLEGIDIDTAKMMANVDQQKGDKP